MAQVKPMMVETVIANIAAKKRAVPGFLENTCSLVRAQKTVKKSDMETFR